MVTGFSIGIKENSQDIARNQTNVTVALTICWNGGSYNATGKAAGTLTVDGVEYPFTAKFNTAQKTSGSEVIYYETLDIPHLDDGSKSLSCSAVFATGTQVGTVTAEATKALTSIPRESTIGATDANIGAIAVISVNRKNAEYTHSISYEFGQCKGYLADGAGTPSETESKLTAVSLSFPIPEAFYAQIPDAKSGVCKLTIRTYSNDDQIGEDKSCTFTVTASEEKCRPEVSGTVVDINPATLALTGEERVLVRGISTALCTIDAQERNGASLIKKSVCGIQIAENEQVIPNAENSTFVFSATDSRGYTATYEATAETVEYVKITCNAEAYRTDPTSGNGVLTVKGNCFSGSFGAQENTLQVYYRIDGGEYVQLQPQITENQYTAVAQLRNMDYQAAHTITVVAQDKLTTVERNLTVGKGIPVFDWGENDFCFHVPVSIQGVALDRVIEEGISGIWHYRIWSSGYVELDGKKEQMEFPNLEEKGSIFCASCGGYTFPLELEAIYSASFGFLSTLGNVFYWAEGVSETGIENSYCGSGTDMQISGCPSVRITGKLKGGISDV